LIRVNFLLLAPKTQATFCQPTYNSIYTFKNIFPINLFYSLLFL